MTPLALAHLRVEELKKDEEYHIRMVSGDLYSGKLWSTVDKEILIVQIANVGSGYPPPDLGSHKVWLSVEWIESIEERS